MGPIRLVVGLGNPGPRYQGTRHNVGFDLLDRIAEEFGARFSPWRDLGWAAQITHPAQGSIPLVKPRTFMNLSGRMAEAYARTEGLQAADLLICFDDIALPAGRVRLRRRGSSGGHRGMISVIEALGTEDIPRLRIGVGPVPVGMDAAEFVLERISRSERAAIEQGLDRALEAFKTVLAEGLESSMNRFNPQI